MTTPNISWWIAFASFTRAAIPPGQQRPCGQRVSGTTHALLRIATLAALLLGAVPMQALVIDFDDVPDQTVIDTYYSSLGLPVTFNNPIGGSVYARAYTLAESLPNVVSVFRTGTFPFFDARNGAVEVVFSVPQSYVSIDAAIGRLPQGLGTPSNRPRLEIYDTAGAFVTAVDWDFNVIPQPRVGAITDYQTLSYASPTPSRIGKVRILSTLPSGTLSNYGLFDNLLVRSQRSHDLCQTGGVLDETCDPCVATICELHPSCCQTSWDAYCVGEVESICGSAQCAPGTIEVDAFDGGFLEAVFNPQNGWVTGAVTGPIRVDGMYSYWPFVGDPRTPRQYHKFDLSGVSPWIAHAALELELPHDGTDSPGSSFTQTLVLRQVSSGPDTFGFDFSAGATRPFSFSVFSDLADGPTYASRAYDEADEGTLTVMPLDAVAVDDINAARGGVFSIGGHLDVSRISGTALSATASLFQNTGDADSGNDPRLGLPTVRRLVLTPSVCGNWLPEPGEGCDDGNTVAGDGCSATCQVEPPPPSGGGCGMGVELALLMPLLMGARSCRTFVKRA